MVALSTICFFGYQEILPHAASTFQEVILEQSLKVRISFPTLIYAQVLSFCKVFSLDLCIFEFVRVSYNSNPCNYLLTKFLSLPFLSLPGLPIGPW